MNMKTLCPSSNNSPLRRMGGVLGALALAAALAPASASAQQATQDGITVSSPSSGATKYLVSYVNVTVGNSPGGYWFEIPYAPARPVTFVDNNSAPITLSNVGFFLSNTEIPLDNLNFNDYPPPGSSGSMFNPAPSFDSTLNPQGSETGGVPDASSTATLIGLAFGGMRVFGRRMVKR